MQKRLLKEGNKRGAGPRWTKEEESLLIDLMDQHLEKGVVVHYKVWDTIYSKFSQSENRRTKDGMKQKAKKMLQSIREGKIKASQKLQDIP